MVSIVIPARNEIYLENTIRDILDKATGEIEIIAVLDGYWPHQVISPFVKKPLELVVDDRVHYIHRGESYGMRAGINSAVAIAKGEYILKLDGHCILGEGFDEILVADCGKNEVVVPRRKRLDGENWKIQEVGKPDIDYMFLAAATDGGDWGGAGLNGKVWDEKNADENLRGDLIVELMSAQGSCWLMRKDYFYELELMDDKSYGTFWNEFQEIGLKCWLSGGRVVRNKKTWYAHLHKGKKYGRGYFLGKSSLREGAEYTKKWLTNEAWHKQTLPLSWLIEKFAPVPTWTPELIAKIKKYDNKVPVKNA